MAAAYSRDTEKLVRAVNELSSEGVVPAVRDGIREMTEGYIIPYLEGIRAALEAGAGSHRQEAGSRCQRAYGQLRGKAAIRWSFA